MVLPDPDVLGSDKAAAEWTQRLLSAAMVSDGAVAFGYLVDAAITEVISIEVALGYISKERREAVAAEIPRVRRGPVRRR